MRLAWWLIAAIPLAIWGADLKAIEARAEALRAKGDAAGALAAWQEAAAANPRSARYEDEIGFLLAVMNRRSDAIAHLERSVNLDSHYAPAQFHLGAAYFLDHEIERSIAHLQSAAAPRFIHASASAA
jgi:tetratricopeptide (TPR) repeat protein